MNLPHNNEFNYFLPRSPPIDFLAVPMLLAAPPIDLAALVTEEAALETELAALATLFTLFTIPPNENDIRFTS
jgi:hypothetical protein